MSKKTWIDVTWPDNEGNFFQGWNVKDHSGCPSSRLEIVKEVLSKFRDEVSRRAESGVVSGSIARIEEAEYKAMRDIFRELGVK